VARTPDDLPRNLPDRMRLSNMQRTLIKSMRGVDGKVSCILLLLIASTITSCFCLPSRRALTPTVAQEALLDLVSDPSMNGFRPEKFPGTARLWRSEFLDTIQGPESLKAIAGHITYPRRPCQIRIGPFHCDLCNWPVLITDSRSAGQLRIGPFECDLLNQSVEFGTESGAGDERYQGVFVQDQSGRWRVKIVKSWFTGW
jgi:hypothetical protein